MDSITCALCDRAFLPDDRAIFIGIERLLLHGDCYDAALEGSPGDTPRGRKLEELIEASKGARRT
jgi:hypothetical protein